ncbi:hypothetical protein Agub_g1112 [Astrephomene gubernaculifera]|uniref:Uncharacterized protein n=1 Tax=Astrephomene gubernaculifera TaxID=47775 RepID=A0AAD3DFX7_9CHLO|nr:hypothetical protein Agub_g1112 [Astrephomene gubernaculifera]
MEEGGMAYRTRARARSATPVPPTSIAKQPVRARKTPTANQTTGRKRTASVAELARTAPCDDTGLGLRLTGNQGRIPDIPHSSGIDDESKVSDHEEDDDEILECTALPTVAGVPSHRAASPQLAPSGDSDVVVVEEASQPEIDDDVVLADSPNKRPRTAEHGSTDGSDCDDLGDDEDLRVTGATGQVVNRDLPHLRPDCADRPFMREGATSNGAHCGNCFCYVCDVEASKCEFWGTGSRERDHANAHNANPIWRKLRDGRSDKDKLRKAFLLEGPLSVPRRRSEAVALGPIVLDDDQNAAVGLAGSPSQQQQQQLHGGEAAAGHRYALRSRARRAEPAGQRAVTPASESDGGSRSTGSSSDGGADSDDDFVVSVVDRATRQRTRQRSASPQRQQGSGNVRSTAARGPPCTAAGTAAAAAAPIYTGAYGTADPAPAPAPARKRGLSAPPTGPALQRIQPVLATVFPNANAMIMACNKAYASYRLPLDVLRSYVARQGRPHGFEVLEHWLNLTMEVRISYQGESFTASYRFSSGVRAKDAKQLAGAACLEKLLVEKDVRWSELYPAPPGYKQVQEVRRAEASISKAAEQAAAEQAAAGQAVAGQAVAGQAVAGQAVAGQAMAGQAVAGQAVAGQAAAGQAVAGQAVAGQAAAGQAVAGQAAAGQTAAGQAAAGQAAAGQAAAGQAAAGQAVAGQAALARAQAGASTSGRAAPPQSPRAAAAPWQGRSGQHAPDRSSPMRPDPRQGGHAGPGSWSGRAGGDGDFRQPTGYGHPSFQQHPGPFMHGWDGRPPYGPPPYPHGQPPAWPYMPQQQPYYSYSYSYQQGAYPPGQQHQWR